MSRLVIVSNRVASLDASTKGNVGGLAVGIFAAMEESGGLWFGWNGKFEKTQQDLTSLETQDDIDFVTTGLTQTEYGHYYKGFANSVLWPLFHQRPDLMNYKRNDFEGYERVNEKFATRLLPYLKQDDLIWVHDYHLIPFAVHLRNKGLQSPMGFFLHIPLPPLDLLRAVPEHRSILKSLLAYDLVGFQTETDVRAFREAVKYSLNAELEEDGWIKYGNHRICARVYPIGIETDSILSFVEKGKLSQEYKRLEDGLGNRKLIMGVDRLDYSKGLVHRFSAYERLLKDYPAIHRKIVLLQVAPTSRGDVQAYSDLAKQIDRIVGHVIGTYAEFDWMPLRYINRGFRRNTILAMYNLAKVGLVTPLRDGMNLVAKEYVAAQNPEDPGVLVLSKMAGASAELSSAVIVNPYDIENVSKRLSQALSMPLEERKERWQNMFSVLQKNNIHEWHRRFTRDLKQCHSAISPQQLQLDQEQCHHH